MPASQEQKVDFLLKKIGYSASKTGIAEDESTIGLSTNTAKKPFEEGIASPLVIPSTSILSDSSFIPTTPPGSDTTYIKVYPTSSALRMTRDSTVGTNTRSYIAYTTYNDTSSARLTNWIDTQFGSSYIIKVFKGDPNSSGVELQQAGGDGGNDGWFFDYSSGVLNFNGIKLPSGIDATNIYIVGYRYIGATGVQPPAGIGTFRDLHVSGVSTFMGSIHANSHLRVSGISTFNGLIDANGLIEATAGQNKIPSLYSNYSDLPSASTYHGMFAHVHATGRGYFAHANGWFELVNKETTGIVGTGTERYDIGYLDATNLYVSGITTLGSIGISTGLISGPAITYIDPATVGDDTGLLVVKGNLQVDGTQTTVNSSTMTVTDKNIELAKGAANDAAADGGGITIKSGDGDKTWRWLNGTDSWTSSEHVRIPDDKVFGFASDTDTYIGRPVADTITFTHGGSEKVRITSDGKVGIGTTNPSQKLEVYDGHLLVKNLTDDAAKVILRDNSGSYNHYQIRNENGTFKIRNSGASPQYDAISVLSTGNIGINSTIPTARLDVVGNTKLQGDLNVTGITTSGRLNVTGITTTLQLQVGTLGHTMVGITTILDEDNMASDSATALVTQQSIKKYVDDRTPEGIGGASLSITADDSGNTSIDLATETLDIEGTANEIVTATGTGIPANKVVIGLPDNVSITGDVGIGASLNVVGVSTLSGEVGIGSALNVVGVSTFQDDVTINKDKDLIFDRFGVTKTTIGYNDTLTLTQIRNANDSLEIGYRPIHLMWLTDRVLSTKLGGVNITGDTETDTLSVGGTATFTGTISAGSTTGTDGYYLKTTGIGVTWAPFPSSRTGLTTSATAGQTTFNFSYNVGFVDVFVNGVKLPSSEFTASNGSTIVLDDAAFENDTLEFISLNTLPVTSSSGAQNLTGLADVTITGTPVIGETLQHNGSEFVNDYTVTATTTSTSQTAILSLPVATYRSAEYTIQVTEGTKYHVTKVLAIHDGTNVTFNEYGTLLTSTSLSTFALDVSSGNMRLLATPASTNSTAFKVKFTGIKV